MSSKREGILDQAKTALAGTSGVDTRIYRSRVVPLQRQDFPALVIEPLADTPSVGTVDRVTWDLVFAVTALVRAETMETTLDPIMEDVHEKIIGDATLNGMLVQLIPDAVDWQFLEADKPVGVAVMRFRATYQTALASISSV